MMEEKEREKKIKAEKATLNKIFARIPKNKKKLVEGLIQNAAFMKVNLEELQQNVVESGAMIAYTSGNGFETIRDNPAQKAYTTMISRYSAVIDQLNKMLPDKNDIADEFESFLND